MYVVEVIPLTNLPIGVPQVLSYFFDQYLQKGSVVEINVANRKVNAIVISAVPLEQRKILLKKSGFELKKIGKVVEAEVMVSDVQLKIAGWLAHYYQAPLGMCLKTVLPSFFLKKKYKLTVPDSKPDEKTKEIKRPILLLTRAKDTLKNIKHLIKNAVQNKEQVLIVVPEIGAIKYFYEELGMYNETAIVYSQLTSKKLFKSWQDIASGNAEIIVGTRQALFVPFKKLGLVIVEDQANDAYKSDMTPKYNTGDVALKIAGLYGCNMVYTSSAPTLDDYFKIKNDVLGLDNKTGSVRPQIKAEDMIKELKTGNFSLLSRDLQSSILSAVGQNKKILIFSPRKGYRGIMLCENCGYLVKCKDCSVAMRVHQVPEPMMICHRCHKTQSIPTSCPNCNSHNVKSTGLPGSQKISEELERLLTNKNSKAPIVIFDADTAGDSDEEEKIIKQMEAGGPLIVVATHKVFSRRYYQNFNLIGIINADAMSQGPDFRSDEKLFYQLEKLLDFSPEEVIIQSYDSTSQAISAVSGGDNKTFYDSELLAREILYYPPFSRIIKLTFKHKDQQKALYAARILAEKFKMLIAKIQLDKNVQLIGPSPAFIEREKDLYIFNLIIKMPVTMTPEEITKYVPSYWSVDIDPKSTI